MKPACHQRSATAEAFSAFLFPHLLFVDSFIERRMAAAMCWLAWNLSHVYDADQRERELMRACKRLPNDNLTSTNSEVDAVLQNQIRDLIACKQHLFPHIMGAITQVKLDVQEGADVLTIQANGSLETTELVSAPDISTLPDTIGALAYINNITGWQLGQLQQVRHTRRIDDIQATRRASAYFLQRADLIAYRIILNAWRDTTEGVQTKANLRYWLEIVEDIRANTEAVLRIYARQEIRDINLIEP